MVTSYITEIQYQDQRTNMGTSVVIVKDLTEISKSQNKLLKMENYSREWKEHLEQTDESRASKLVYKYKLN